MRRACPFPASFCTRIFEERSRRGQAPPARAAHARDRAVSCDGAARARESARSAGPLDHPHGDRRARFPDAAADLRGGHPRAASKAISSTRRRSVCRSLREADRRVSTARATASTSRRSASPSRRAPPAALLLALAALVDPGAEVLVSDPGYPANRHFVRMLEGEPVNVPVGPRQQLPDDAGAARALLDRAHVRGARRHAVEPDRHGHRARGPRARWRVSCGRGAARSSSTRSITASSTKARRARRWK